MANKKNEPTWLVFEGVDLDFTERALCRALRAAFEPLLGHRIDVTTPYTIDFEGETSNGSVQIKFNSRGR